MDGSLYLEETRARAGAVQQALANLRGRGVAPKPEVIALYRRYVDGLMSRKQQRGLIQQRAEAIRHGSRSEPQGDGPTNAADPLPA